MKLTKKITIKAKDKNIEIQISQEGSARWDSEKFKDDFENIINSIIISLIKSGQDFSNIQ